MAMLLPRPTPRSLVSSLVLLRAAAPRRLPFSSHTSYPLYYELVSHSPSPRRKTSPLAAAGNPPPDSPPEDGESHIPNLPKGADKAKRKYYKKMVKRMYGGSDSDSDSPPKGGEQSIELIPQVVDFPTLHSREEEIYFYDTFAMPWEKDKHYRMVYQLEKKYFPDQCLDRAFVDVEAKEDVGSGAVFFEDEGGKGKEEGGGKGVEEKKVEQFFKCLRKKPNDETGPEGQALAVPGDPFLSSAKLGLPPRWDGPAGTVVLVNKPKGWTSFTVCGKLRHLVKVQKVGHAGTLDPMATGLLIVCVGKATKLVDRYQGMVKGYSGSFRLGEATSTWDADSPVIQREPWEHIKDEDIRKAAASFCGEIWQVPPMFSAIKVGGKRMYDKARRGETVELSPRRISIFQFDVERSLDDRQNVIFRVICSKGTYIRSLCADIGKALGSCAHMTALRRDLIGQYSVDDAWEFQELQEQIIKGYM